MKVVTAETMQLMDGMTIRERGVAGLTLMENAGRGCTAAIMDLFGASGSAVIVAGKGNNGGDGYVIARLLSDQGWKVKVYVLAARDRITGDARTNLEFLPETMVTFCHDAGMLDGYAPLWESATVVVDAIFGTGLKDDVTGIYREAIALINGCGKPVVAVDIPSGIDGSTGKVWGAAVNARLTVTFAAAKLGHVLYPGTGYCGTVRVVDIGIPADIVSAAPGFEYSDSETIASLIRPRSKTSHKGTYGHSLIIAGSTGKTGAAAMAANSAVRAGSGLVTVAVPSSLNPIIEVKTTEAMSIPVLEGKPGFFGPTSLQMLSDIAEGKDAIAVGPGVSWTNETGAVVRGLAAGLALPMVIDADGLNALSEEPTVLLGRKSAAVVLTPHPGEMSRLAGVATADVESDRIRIARDFAAQYQVHLVLKGARTVIAAPDGRVAINGSGNPGMASGGMGDVLTGVLTALLAQGYEAFDACRVGVFVHGYAADLVAAEKGETGLSAVDVQERLPYAFHHLLKLRQ